MNHSAWTKLKQWLFRRESLLAVGLFGVALSFRIFYLFELLDSPFFYSPRLDGLFHDRWALSIASGNFLGDEVFFRAPFYPYVLAVMYSVFGHDYVIPRIAQFLLGSIAAALLYLFGRKIFGEGAALPGAVLFAIYPVEIYFEGDLLLESILGFLCVLFLFLSYRAHEKPGTLLVFLTGFSLGVLAITRPPLLPVGIGLILYLTQLSPVNRSPVKQTSRLFVLFVSGLLIPIVIVTARNYSVGDDLVFIASQGGINFYIGNNPEADGYSSSMPHAGQTAWENRDVTYSVGRELGYAPKPSEESSFWYRRGLEFIVDQPLDFLWLTARKAFMFWNDYEIPNNQSYYFSRQFSSLLTIIPVSFGVIVPLGLVGIVLSWRSVRSRPLVLFVAIYFLITILFFVCDRYRVPVFPVLCLLAGVTIIDLFRKIRRRKFKDSGLIVAGCVALGVFSNLELAGGGTRANHARDYIAVGIAQLEKGNNEAARASFSKADSINPSYPNLHTYIAGVDWREGRKESSIENLRRELELNQESFPALINLAFIFFESNRLDSAIHFGARAVQRKPHVAAGYTIMGQSLLKLNDVARAESVLTHGSRECGPEFMYGEYLMAGIQLKRGDHEAAETAYRSILRRLSKPRQPMYEPEFSFSTVEKTGLSEAELRGKLLYGLGSVFVFRNQVDSAKVYFGSAISFIKSDPSLWADYGVALMRLREFEKASEALSMAISIDSLNYLFWYNHGTALVNLHRFDAAKISFERCLALNRNFRPAESSLAILAGKEIGKMSPHY